MGEGGRIKENLNISSTAQDEEVYQISILRFFFFSMTKTPQIWSMFFVRLGEDLSVWK